MVTLVADALGYFSEETCSVPFQFISDVVFRFSQKPLDFMYCHVEIIGQVNAAFEEITFDYFILFFRFITVEILIKGQSPLQIPNFNQNGPF